MPQFAGTSDKGNFQEALEEAKSIALKQLETDFIQYKVVTIEGTNGGFVLEDKLTVTIDAHGPKK